MHGCWVAHRASLPGRLTKQGDWMKGPETYWAGQTEGKHFCTSLHFTMDALPKRFFFTRSFSDDTVSWHCKFFFFFKTTPITSVGFTDEFMQSAHTRSQRFYLKNISKLALKVREVQKKGTEVGTFLSQVLTHSIWKVIHVGFSPS